MRQKSVKGLFALGLLLVCTVFSVIIATAEVEKTSEFVSNGQTFEKLDPNKVTTTWNDSYLFSSKDDALKGLESLKQKSSDINKTFRPKFENLSGPVLLDYLETESEFAKSFEVLFTYAYTQNSKNVNDPFFISLLSDSQNLSTDDEKTNAFVTVKLKSLHKDDWDKLFSEEPKLEMYRPFIEATI
jgi:oligoendopeptidase F